MDANICSLSTLEDDLIKVHKFKPTIKWRQSFENYLKTMPPYYIGVNRLALFPRHLLWGGTGRAYKKNTSLQKSKFADLISPQSLKKALRIMGAPNLLADNMEYGLSYSVVSYLKKLSQQVRGFRRLNFHACNVSLASLVLRLRRRSNHPFDPFLLLLVEDRVRPLDRLDR